MADDVALILLAFVSANARNCQRPSSSLKAVELLLALNRHLSDETRLDRLVPYLVSLLQGEAASVRSSALTALTATVSLCSYRTRLSPLTISGQLDLVTHLTPANASVFTEYILPNTRAIAADIELLPRVAYARSIASLANTGTRFLDVTEALKSQGKMRTDLSDFDSQASEVGHSLVCPTHEPPRSHPSDRLTTRGLANYRPWLASTLLTS